MATVTKCLRFRQVALSADVESSWPLVLPFACSFSTYRRFCFNCPFTLVVKCGTWHWYNNETVIYKYCPFSWRYNSLYASRSFSWYIWNRFKVIWRSSWIGWWLGQKWPCRRKWLSKLNRCSGWEGLDQNPVFYGFLSLVKPADKIILTNTVLLFLVFLLCKCKFGPLSSILNWREGVLKGTVLYLPSMKNSHPVIDYHII